MNAANIIQYIKDYFKSEVVSLPPGKPLTHTFFDEIRTAAEKDLRKIFELFKVTGLDNNTFDQLYQTAINEYLSVNPIDIDPSVSLTKKGFKVWLTEERKRTIPDDYINRYLTLLRNEGRSEKVIEEIRTSSEKILGMLGDPKSDKSFYRRGLIVGSVQSGKTGNFNAVINRAIDAGYSLIIVLSGIMEDLRSQTQKRIENDVIGEGIVDVLTGKKNYKGVGKIKRFGDQGDATVRQVFPITSYSSDFNQSVKESDFSLNNKNILICKKNTGVLKNLLIWLSERLDEKKGTHDIPLLIIDDEADNASLNNLGHKGREYASTINGHIRALLGLFSRKAYIGYTATPFANVIQDRNPPAEGKWRITYKLNGQTVEGFFNQESNLFPDDFIELLNPPTNYIGAKQIFQTVLEENEKKIPVVVPVVDSNLYFPSKVVEEADGTIRVADEDDGDEVKTRASRRDDNFPEDLPDSLKEAILCFILSTAVRLGRKAQMANSKLYNPHNTMLVHVSRFIPWQNKTKNLIQKYVSLIESDINNDLPSNPKSVYGLFEKMWNKYYADIIANIRFYLPDGYSDEFLIPKLFSDIKPLLINAVRDIDVKAVNSQTGDKLIYSEDNAGNGRKIIAVGGNRLSRGFTLEGLTINYFVRNTNYSDTLLQMGRWFGYRPGYLDCCKIFTTIDAIEKFDSTTKTIEELEAEFKKMNRNDKTPADFELRVRKHPGVLKITRPSILKNSIEVNWSYQDSLEQTTKFDLNAQRIASAWNEFNGLIANYKNDLKPENDFFVIHGDHKLLFKFLDLGNSFHGYTDDIIQIKKFVELCVVKNKMKKWTVAIRRKGEKNSRKISDLNINRDAISLPIDIELTTRRGPEKSELWRSRFLQGVFSASGKSANIITRGKDLSLLLSDSEIKSAESEFIKERMDYLMSDKGKSKGEAQTLVEKITKPENIYRRKMNDENGLLLVYLMDTQKVFRQDGQGDEELQEMSVNRSINLDIPLIGYAIGFPPISPDPGGVYVRGNFDLDREEESEVDEWNEELESLDE